MYFQGRVTPSPSPKNKQYFQGWVMASPVHKNIFLGADDGMTRPYKWIHVKNI